MSSARHDLTASEPDQRQLCRLLLLTARAGPPWSDCCLPCICAFRRRRAGPTDALLLSPARGRRPTIALHCSSCLEAAARVHMLKLPRLAAWGRPGLRAVGHRRRVRVNDCGAQFGRHRSLRPALPHGTLRRMDPFDRLLRGVAQPPPERLVAQRDVAPVPQPFELSLGRRARAVCRLRDGDRARLPLLPPAASSSCGGELHPGTTGVPNDP
jgi:hypothetical protein